MHAFSLDWISRLWVTSSERNMIGLTATSPNNNIRPTESFTSLIFWLTCSFSLWQLSPPSTQTNIFNNAQPPVLVVPARYTRRLCAVISWNNARFYKLERCARWIKLIVCPSRRCLFTINWAKDIDTSSRYRLLVFVAWESDNMAAPWEKESDELGAFSNRSIVLNADFCRWSAYDINME